MAYRYRSRRFFTGPGRGSRGSVYSRWPRKSGRRLSSRLRSALRKISRMKYVLKRMPNRTRSTYRRW